MILGLDPGFRSFGWCVVEDGELHGLGVIRTDKDQRKVLVCEDQHRRGQLIAEALFGLKQRFEIRLVCSESISLPRSASVSAMQGRAFGVLDAFCQTYELPLIQASPQAIKKAATGKKSASKQEVKDALDALFVGRLSELLRTMRAKTLHEHAVDALGAVVACRDHPTYRAALNAKDPL